MQKKETPPRRYISNSSRKIKFHFITPYKSSSIRNAERETGMRKVLYTDRRTSKHSGKVRARAIAYKSELLLAGKHFFRELHRIFVRSKCSSTRRFKKINRPTNGCEKWKPTREINEQWILTQGPEQFASSPRDFSPFAARAKSERLQRVRLIVPPPPQSLEYSIYSSESN